MKSEYSYDLTSARRIWSMDAAAWLGRESLVHWLEWNHLHEQTRHLSHIVSAYQSMNWHRLIKPGSTCIDVGAHSGDTAVVMGLLAYDKARQARGRVVAVEPNPDLRSILTACLGLNAHVADFFFETCAITEKDTLEVELADHGNQGCNGGVIGTHSTALMDRIPEADIKRYTAKGRSLQSLVETHARAGRSDDIQFIKTDCEGYDQDILRGAAPILQEIKPHLFVEWFDGFDAEQISFFLEVIREIGYIPLNPFNLEHSDVSAKTPDVIAIHKSRLSEIRA